MLFEDGEIIDGQIEDGDPIVDDEQLNYQEYSSVRRALVIGRDAVNRVAAIPGRLRSAANQFFDGIGLE